MKAIYHHFYVHVSRVSSLTLSRVTESVFISLFEGVRSKRAFFLFGPSSRDQKGLSDTNKFLTPLACEALFKQFYSLFKHYFKVLFCPHYKTFTVRLGHLKQLKKD